MAPLAAKEATVLVLDVGKNVTQVDPQDVNKETFFEKSCTCLSKLIQRKIFSKPKDEIGLILLGSEVTNNMLASSLGGYNNIEESFCLSMSSWHMLHYVNNNVKPTQKEADWLDGIIVAMDYLREQTEAKKFSNKKMILFTNFASAINDEESNINQIIEGIKNLGIQLVVIGANVLPEFDSGNESDFEKSFFSQKVSKMPNQEDGEKIISKIVKETNGAICNFQDAITELMYFENKQVNPSPWYSDLQIGPDIKISICGYKKISDDTNLPTWKKCTTLPNATCEIKRQYFKQAEDNPKLDPSDLIPGYKYGATVVPYTSADETMSYASGPRCLTILGFTKLSNINREWLSGKGVIYIVPRKDYKASERAFSALVDALHIQHLVGIARRVYNFGNAPYIQCLMPKITSRYKCLVMVQLPFLEDLNFLAFPPLLGKKVTPNKEQLDAVDELIDSMNLMKAAITDDGEPMEAYHVKRTLNPFLQHAYQSLAFRAMYKDKEILPVQKDVLDLLSVPQKLVENSQNSLKRISQLFPISEKKEMISGKNKWINRRLEEVGKEDKGLDEQLPDVKDVKMTDVLKTVLVEVGTVHPSKDFEILISRGDDVSTVIKQMQRVIHNLVMKSMDADCGKPIAALKTMRNRCLQSHTEDYNDWLREFKDVLIKSKKLVFWNNVVQEKLGLITVDETSASTVSHQEAVLFLEIRDQVAADEDQDLDADDLFDEM